MDHDHGTSSTTSKTTLDPQNSMDVVSETEEDLHPAATNGQVSAAVTNTEEDDPNGGTWDIAMSLRARKKVRRQERTAENAAGATDPAGLEGKVTGDSGTSGGAGGRGTASDQKSADVERRSRPRQRAPPLPRNDIKIILKPKPGLAVRDLKTYEVARAIMEAAGGSAAGFKCDDMIIHLRPGSNIVIVSTALEEHGKRIEKIKHLNLNGKSHPMSTYVTTPEYLLKGVIHGINTDVTDDEIIDNICVRTQGVEVLQARRLGESKTVLLMFDGDVLPRYVYLFGGETPCVPYQPTRQYCRTCQETGHRTDVCPKAVTSQCAQCGMGDPPQDHVCKTTCAFCGGEHATGAPECQKKLKQIQSRDRPKPQQQQHRSRPNQRGNIKERWLSSERERSVTPGRSKSRSRPESKGRSSSPEARQPPPPQQKQKKLKQANKEIEVFLLLGAATEFSRTEQCCISADRSDDCTPMLLLDGHNNFTWPLGSSTLDTAISKLGAPYKPLFGDLPPGHSTDTAMEHSPVLLFQPWRPPPLSPPGHRGAAPDPEAGPVPGAARDPEAAPDPGGGPAAASPESEGGTPGTGRGRPTLPKRVAHARSEIKDMFTEIQKTVSSILTDIAGLTARVIRIEEVVGLKPPPKGHPDPHSNPNIFMDELTQLTKPDRPRPNHRHNTDTNRKEFIVWR
ncbi:hypothetical protein HPB49_004782 [Dermacentor silvarum]|uniref:Uncharacterized protein n=1 Tax=Dermacentor silvarum TaxID=543639 RepID=A0ACB8DUR9_DERSI|nr:hypothetical protein HPB49_004782 [Dermacentor silvarum]